MTPVLLNGTLCPTTHEGVKNTNSIRVSWVENAKSTLTRDADAKEIVAVIRYGKAREPIENIRQTFTNVMEKTGDRKAAKEAVGRLKRMLRGVLWSGRFSSRKQNALVEHSGLLCADLDELGDQVPEVREKLLTSPYLWALFLSPTGDGLKAVFRVTADAEKHKASFHAVEEHVRELTDMQIDEACSDVARLCFLSHDPDVYLSEDADELPPLSESENRQPNDSALPTAPEIKMRREIAEEVLGEIDWETETEGYCGCPAQHLHTTGDGPHDCKVFLDSVPTIKCFHSHCKAIIEGVNHELRSRIGKAEFTSGVNAPNQWFDERFPLLSEQFGPAVRIVRPNNAPPYVQDIAEDFIAATLGEESRPNTPTIFVPSEQKFYAYEPSDGIYVHRREPTLFAGLSRLLLDCARACANAQCDTSSLKFHLRDSNNLSGVLKKARGLLEVPQDFFSTNLTEFIPCANGMLRLNDKTLLPFSPTYRRRNKLAVPYEANAECPLFLETLMKPALDPEELDLVQRWCGLTLIGENVAQKLLILIGTPGGGKGTIVRVVTGIIGPMNVASLRTQLLAERFELGRFLGKTLLYGADVPENFLNHRGASVLKSLTGYDPVTLEFKNSNESPLITCKFNVIVTCNSRLTVHLEGDTEAWRRRLAIVTYDKPKPTKVIADLDQQILGKEASGVLNWMIEGLDKIRADGWQLQLTTGQQKVVDDLLLESDGHNLFVREALNRDDGGQLTVPDCFAAYVAFCTDRGWTTLTRNKFSSMIGDAVVRTYGLTVRNDVKDGGGRAQRGWKGLQLRDKNALTASEEGAEVVFE